MQKRIFVPGGGGCFATERSIFRLESGKLSQNGGEEEKKVLKQVLKNAQSNKN